MHLQESRIVQDLYKSLNTGYCGYNFGCVGMKHATSWLLVATKVSQVYGAIEKQTLVRKNKCRKAGRL